MLVCALANALYIFHFARDPGPAQNETAVTQQTPDKPSLMSKKWGNGPGWYGVVKVVKAEDGFHEVTVEALDNEGNGVLLTSYEATLFRAGSESDPLPADFTRDPGNRIKARVRFPATGEWIISVKLHRERSTLVFSERFSVD